MTDSVMCKRTTAVHLASCWADIHISATCWWFED